MKKFVLFTADWCEPGNRMKEVLQKFADRNKITLEVYDLESEEAKKKYVRSSPVIHIYPNGRKVAKDKIYKLYGYLTGNSGYSKMCEITGTSIQTKTFEDILIGLQDEVNK